MFISPERKKSTVTGTGIQYIPGHVDPFIDIVIQHYLPPGARILDLGGGGLRFGLPAAAGQHLTTVVDLDADALRADDIMRRAEENGKVRFDAQVIQKYLTTVCDDAFNYLPKSADVFDIITAFRLLHFCQPSDVPRFFATVKQHLTPNGIFVFSATTFLHLPLKREKNVLTLNSEPVDVNFPYFRKFKNDDEAVKIRENQNLGDFFHFFDIPLVQTLADANGLDVVMAGFPSTAVVEGYVLCNRP